MTESHRTIASAAIEAHDIHMATCRARRQGLICSVCAELVVRVVRALEAR